VHGASIPDHGIARSESRAGHARSGGDTVHLRVELDSAPREVEIPAALEAALEQNAAARAAFDELSYTHRKEHARWVAEAKQDATRERRVTKVLEMLRS
jgi:uncharacterized protein YdeI (YjbR/CyaY-like superfamily)